MTSGWVCLAVDLQVDPQNDATLNSDRKFRSVPLRLFSPSAESTPAFIVASFSSILRCELSVHLDIMRAGHLDTPGECQGVAD